MVTSLTLYLDISRHYNPKIKDLITRILGKFLRKEEESGEFVLSGSSFMALGFLISCLFFSKGLAVTSWLILIISDCLAAIVGITVGTPLANGKSVAGSGAFMVSAFLISIICYFLIGYNTTFGIIFISCLLTTLAEFYSKQIKVNDNLSIPLTYGFATLFFSLFV
jgi:dolichol kinase